MIFWNAHARLSAARPVELATDELKREDDMADEFHGFQSEAEMVEHLMRVTNPTGRLHSATPWVASGETEITAAGAVIAQFRHTDDRDVALYFANNHAAVISLMRMAGQGLDAIAV